jgi:hypothetical protein
LAQYIREGIEKGEMRPDVDPMIGALLFLGTLRGMMLQVLLNPSAVDLELVHTQMLAFVENALASVRPL